MKAFQIKGKSRKQCVTNANKFFGGRKKWKSAGAGHWKKYKEKKGRYYVLPVKRVKSKK